jgi:hypothetical protein
VRRKLHNRHIGHNRNINSKENKKTTIAIKYNPGSEEKHRKYYRILAVRKGILDLLCRHHPADHPSHQCVRKQTEP